MKFISIFSKPIAMSNYKNIEKIIKKLGLLAPTKEDTNLTLPSRAEVDIKHFLNETSKYIQYL